VNAADASPADIISATMEGVEFLAGIKAWKCGLCQCVTLNVNIMEIIAAELHLLPEHDLKK